MISKSRNIILFLLVFLLSVITATAAVAAPSKPANRVYKEYYDNGKVRLFLRFKNGLITRKRAFYRNGRLKLDHKYKDGLALKIRNFYETGELFSVWTKKSGATIYYYRNGKVKDVWN